jgi:Plasmid pRiA4b ORF-3-like protein
VPAGKRALPPEDCWGIPGYYMFLEVMQDPRHPGYDAMLEWLGERCDPEAFDLDALNRELKPLT